MIEASTGAVVSTRAFSPYGRILEETGSVQADFAFAGHFHDTDFDIHHAPARVYDANLGRWLTPDPLPDAESLPEGTNLYAYVGNDPVNFIDPFGFCRQSANTAQGSRASPPRQKGGGKSQKSGEYWFFTDFGYSSLRVDRFGRS
ncbi:MAG: RHS repeat-associated core domain-containing protein [Opitutales bacterium]